MRSSKTISMASRMTALLRVRPGVWVQHSEGRAEEPGGSGSIQFRPGDDLVVEVSYNAQKRIEKPILALGVLGATAHVSPLICSWTGTGLIFWKALARSRAPSGPFRYCLKTTP